MLIVPSAFSRISILRPGPVAAGTSPRYMAIAGAAKAALRGSIISTAQAMSPKMARRIRCGCRIGMVGVRSGIQANLLAMASPWQEAVRFCELARKDLEVHIGAAEDDGRLAPGETAA